MMSVHKYGFFLCITGSARIILGRDIYNVSSGCLCIYTPNTFIQILERSAGLDGILEEDAVDAYYPVVSRIDIHKRLQIRHAPCVEITPEQTEGIRRIVDVLTHEGATRLAPFTCAMPCVRRCSMCISTTAP